MTIVGGVNDEKETVCCNRSWAIWGSICRTLSEQGMEVLAIDIDEDRVNEFASIAAHAVVGDTTDENVLKA